MYTIITKINLVFRVPVRYDFQFYKIGLLNYFYAFLLKLKLYQIQLRKKKSISFRLHTYRKI